MRPAMEISDCFQPRPDPLIKWSEGDKYWLKQMTICIAAICDKNKDPKIVFCADRLISGNLPEFNRNLPKIRRLTRSCVILEASDDVLISETILDNVTEIIKRLGKVPTIKEVADIVGNECEQFKTKKIEKDVLSKYLHTSNFFKMEPNVGLQLALQERLNYKYSPFQFIIAGMDGPTETHLYVVNQDGDCKPWDSFGFAMIGSGSSQAISEMLKTDYSDLLPVDEVMTRVYFAKKEAQRIGGVGDKTTFGLIRYLDPVTGEQKPQVAEIPDDSNFTELMENAIKTLDNHRKNIIADVSNEIYQIRQEAIGKLRQNKK